MTCEQGLLRLLCGGARSWSATALVSGDIIINFKLASTNSKVKNYFNLLNALKSKSLINVPTRFSKKQ